MHNASGGLVAGFEATNGSWTELARVRLPVAKRALWKTLLDKTEHPERYNPALRGADVLDHDPSLVLRRIFPGAGQPFTQWVRHELRRYRVEYQRDGMTWATAQAIVEGTRGPCLVYEVSDAEAARAEGGICGVHAERTLSQIVASAQTR